MGGNHTGETGGNEGFSARRGLAVVGAGFEGDVSGRPPRGITRLRQRHAFSMGATACLGMAAADDAGALDDHAAHGRVGPCAAKPPRRKREGVFHMVLVAQSSEAGLGRSSETNLSKSSAA